MDYPALTVWWCDRRLGFVSVSVCVCVCVCVCLFLRQRLWLTWDLLCGPVWLQTPRVIAFVCATVPGYFDPWLDLLRKKKFYFSVAAMFPASSCSLARRSRRETIYTLFIPDVRWLQLSVSFSRKEREEKKGREKKENKRKQKERQKLN